MNYVTFEGQHNGQYAVILAAKISKADLPDHAYMALCDLPYKGGPGGMPTDDELKRLRATEDGLEKNLTRDGAVLVGHIVSGQHYLIVFRTKGPVATTQSVKLGLLSKINVSLHMRPDPDWAWHEANMAVDDAAVQNQANLGLLMQLEQHGDDHAKPRPVDFSSVIPSRPQAEQLLQAIQALGLTLDKHEIDGEWVHFTITTAIEPDIINNLTLKFSQISEQLGGEFDGWACPVTQ
jgi:hypothetical protein